MNAQSMVLKLVEKLQKYMHSRCWVDLATILKWWRISMEIYWGQPIYELSVTVKILNELAYKMVIITMTS